MTQKTILVKHISTPIGTMTAGASEKGICMLQFGKITEFKNHILKKGKSKWIDELATQLKEYFDKKRTTFDIPLDMLGTDFQVSVWNELLKIPFGTTRTYKEQAIAIGNLKAIRAVATANGSNNIPIIIPCHRIIGSDGSLTGFASGLWRKEFLLNLESKQLALF